MNGLTKALAHSSMDMTQFDYANMLLIFGNSLFLGILLAITTYFATSQHLKYADNDEYDFIEKRQLILGSANILFICVGLSGLMILVENNLARAFAIGAAVALVRFRVKLKAKSLGSNLLFGIIAGMACGLDAVPVAWSVTILYIILQVLLYVVLKRVKIK